MTTYRVWWNEDAVTWRVSKNGLGMHDADTISHGMQLAAEDAGRALEWKLNADKTAAESTVG